VGGRGHGREGWGERGQAARDRLAQNPFYVLELRPDCTRAEVEREGQKLLGMLELELSGATHYRSPLGRHRRTPEQVRAAMAELRDPNRRLVHELWATLSVEPAPDVGQDEPDDDDDSSALAPFAALAALGFGRRGSR